MTGRSRSRQIPYGLFAVLLCLDVTVLLIEKRAALQVGASGATFAVGLVRQVWFWLGLALGPIQLWIWTRILSQTELSLAYPVSSISYPVTMLAAQLGFGEQLSARVWAGALCIAVGVAIVGSTAATRHLPQSPTVF